MKVSALLAKVDYSALLPQIKCTSSRSTNWADGLRGIAALGVVSSHLTLSFWTQFVPPCDNGVDGPSELFQRPFFRLVVQGQAWVAIFFILMGFVNPIKPLKQAHFDDVEGALMTLAKSTLSRVSRLVLPAAAVTTIAWLFCQLGFFDLARESGAFWLQSNSPGASESWCYAIWDLLVALVDTWTKGQNIYDQPQWALLYLLKGSMLIFILLLVTINTTPRFRTRTLLLFYGYCWLTGDAIVGFNIAAGMLLSEAHSLSFQPVESRSGRLLTIGAAALGLYLMSFPSEFQDWKPWTRHLSLVGWHIFPRGSDMSRFWCGIGAQLLSFSVFFSPELRAFFSLPILTWLGGISFSLYLLHGPLMRSLLAWMMFGPQWIAGFDYVDDKIPLPGAFAMGLVLLAFGTITLAVSALWTYKVEPYFGMATSKLQDWAVDGRSGQKGALLPIAKQKVERAASDGSIKCQD